MLLVPKQLLRAGMTGNAPYYGGRMSPAQAYAASHPTWNPSGNAAPAPPPRAARASGQASPPAPTRSSDDSVLALQHLLETGVLTRAEYDDLRSRVAE
jgi:hypothetical protein